jgi:hypothetical protein
MKSIWLRGIQAALVFVVALLLLACANLFRPGNDDNSGSDEDGEVTLQSADPANDAYVGTGTKIVVQFDQSLDRQRTSLGGDLGGAARVAQWSNTERTDDTIVIAPSTTWTTGVGQSLQVLAVGIEGAQTVHELRYTVVEVTVSPSSAEVNAGDTLQISAGVLPDVADPTTFTWASSDDSVATVAVDDADETRAVVTADEGVMWTTEARIIASTAGGEATAVATISVLSSRQAPYPIIGGIADDQPATPGVQKEVDYLSNSSYGLEVELSPEGQSDPQGQQIYYRSTPALPEAKVDSPTNVLEQFHLKPDTGELVFTTAGKSGEETIEFYTEDTDGNTSETEAFVVDFIVGGS